MESSWRNLERQLAACTWGLVFMYRAAPEGLCAADFFDDCIVPYLELSVERKYWNGLV